MYIIDDIFYLPLDRFCAYEISSIIINRGPTTDNKTDPRTYGRPFRLHYKAEFGEQHTKATRRKGTSKLTRVDTLFRSSCWAVSP